MNRRDFAFLTALPHHEKKTPAILRSHTQRRVRERYGLNLTRGDLCDLERRVRTGGATFMGRNSGNRSCFRVRAYDREMFFVYDAKRSAFATCLTREMVSVRFPDAPLAEPKGENSGNY